MEKQVEIKKIVFFSHFGCGDIFESKEFVREIADVLTNTEVCYAHAKDHKILKDLAKVKQIDITDSMQIRTPLAVEDETLYVNTWIGITGEYLLPGYACTLERLIDMYNDMFTGLYRFEKNPVEYIPSIDYSFFDVKKIDEFVKDKNLVYVSNGPVHSNQAFNFDFSPILKNLANDFPKLTFVVTAPVDFEAPNVFDGNKVVDVEGFNLNELSYLSRFCNVIIGRNSGPQVFTWTKENCMSSKLNITFSYTKECRHFVYKTPINMVKRWSNAVQDEDIYQFIKDNL